MALIAEAGLRRYFCEIASRPDQALRQRMVALKRASPTALQFYEYVRSEAARGIFRKHGYAVPQ